MKINLKSFPIDSCIDFFNKKIVNLDLNNFMLLVEYESARVVFTFLSKDEFLIIIPSNNEIERLLYDEESPVIVSRNFQDSHESIRYFLKLKELDIKDSMENFVVFLYYFMNCVENEIML